MRKRNRIYKRYMAGAHQRGYVWNLGTEMFYALAGSNCHYCGSPPLREYRSKKGSFFYNGIDRLNNSEGYIEGNVVACCTICNFAKRDTSYKDFAEWVGRVYKRLEEYEK